VEKDIERNDAPDVTLIINGHVRQGQDAIRACAESLRKYNGAAEFIYRTNVAEGEIAFLEWAIDCDGVCIDDGVDTFVIRDGKIVAMTVRYTVRKQGSA
jgi:hypothetical protein